MPPCGNRLPALLLRDDLSPVLKRTPFVNTHWFKTKHNGEADDQNEPMPGGRAAARL